MGSGLRAAMRTVASVVLALALLLVSVPLAAGASSAGDGGLQEDQQGGEGQEGEQAEEQAEVSFLSNCLQLRCQFEVVNADEVVEGNVTSIDWTFGPDGAQKTGSPVVHTFEQAGTYDVHVTVTGNASDNQTAQANATGEVSVQGKQVPLEALGLGVAAILGAIILARLT